MLKLQPIIQNSPTLLSLSEQDKETINYWLSRDGYLIGRYFVCVCGHFNLNHKNKSKECLIANCSFHCGFFREKQIDFNIKLIKNPLSINGFEEFLQNQFIPVPKRRTRIFWYLWERYLEVFI
jgi:hypothetical protein